MGGQLITVRMGMGRVLWRKNGLFNGLMFRMRQWLGDRVVPGIFQLAVPILAGSCLDRDVHIAPAFWRGLSW